MMIRLLLSVLAALVLVAPAAAQNTATTSLKHRTSSTDTDSLKVGCTSSSTTCTGGILAGRLSVNGVVVVGTDGRIPAISSTYFASLSGANLTGITEASITDSTILARVAANEAITGAWAFSNADGIRINNTEPFAWFNESSATANEAKWRLRADGDVFYLQTINDAESAAATVFSVGRTGTVVDNFTVSAAQILVPGCSGLGCASTPSIAAAGDTDSGVYISSTAGFGIVDEGVAIFSVSSAAAGGLTSTGPLTATVLTGGSIAVTGVSFSGLAGMFDRAGGDGTIVSFRSAGVEQGTVSIAGATTAYNTFLGAHYTQLMPGQDEPEVGTVVVSTGQTIPVKPRRLTKAVRMLNAEGLAIGEETIDMGQAPVLDGAERFVYVEPSTRRNQKGVYGVWFADLGQTAAGMSWGDPDAEVFQVASVGLGPGVWVTDTCGPIANGDWLATSPIKGLAERQCTVGAGGRPSYDPVNRDYTLGKALTAVDWSKVTPDADGVRKVRIPLHFAN
jgi:hypothetical protein